MKEINCLNHGLYRLKDFTDFDPVKSKNPCHQSNPGKCLNHRFYRLKDFTDFKKVKLENLCHLRNQNKSVIQTKSVEILNSILELI